MIGVSDVVDATKPLVRLVFVTTDDERAVGYERWLDRLAPHVTGSPCAGLTVVFAAGEGVDVALRTCRSGELAADWLFLADWDADAVEAGEPVAARLTVLCTGDVTGAASWRRHTTGPLDVRVLTDARFDPGGEDSTVIDLLLDVLRVHPKWRPGRTGKERNE